MHIFLQDKVIRLTHKPPGKITETDMLCEYSSLSQVAKVFKGFEKNENFQRLIFWSSENYLSLKKDFISLFKYIKAAGGVVKNEKKELLVIFRFGKWDLPKGKISTVSKKNASQKGKEKKIRELPGDAAIREVTEETGLSQVTISGKLSATYHIYCQNEKLYLKKTYWYRMHATADQQLIPQKEEDISIARWVAPDEIPLILENSYPSLKKLFLSAMQP